MTVAAVVNAKGGTGKTTIAMMLAAVAAKRGSHALLLDADPRQSAVKWSEASTERLPFYVLGQASTTIHRDLPAVRSRFDDIVIDTPGQAKAMDISRSAVLAADVAVIPVPPSAMDLTELADVLDLVEACDRPALVVVVRAHLATTEARTAKHLIEATATFAGMVGEGRARLSRVVIPERVRYRREWGSAPTALTGFDDVWDEIREVAG